MLSGPHARQIARFPNAHCAAFWQCTKGQRLCFAWIMVWAGGVVALRAVFSHGSNRIALGDFAGAADCHCGGRFLGVPQGSVRLPPFRAALDRHGRFGRSVDGIRRIRTSANGARKWPKCRLPTLKWRGGRQQKLLAASVLFLIASFSDAGPLLADHRRLAADRRRDAKVGRQAPSASNRSRFFRPKKAQVLEKEPRSHPPMRPRPTIQPRRWRRLTTSSSRFSKAASQAAESAIKQTETASKASDLAAALQAARDKMDPKQCGEAMKELARLTEEAAAENQALAESLSEELKDAGQLGNLSDAQLRELSKLLKNCKACQRDKLMKMIDAKLIDADQTHLVRQGGRGRSGGAHCRALRGRRR